MKLAGKCPPEPAELEAAGERGFGAVELFLRKEHLDSFEASLSACEEASVDVVSVHTPHVCRDEGEYIERSADLARELDALLVFHSNAIFLRFAVEMGELLGYDRVAYEHNPGVSVEAIRNLILGQGRELVLDAAHLYMATREFERDFADLLEEAGHLHLADSTKVVDGLAFGEGEMDLESMVRVLRDSSYDGWVVVEVMPEYQEGAKKFVEQVLGEGR